MKPRPFFAWLAVCLAFVGSVPFEVAAEEVLISVSYRMRSSNGTLCRVIGPDGEPTGTHAIVRDFYIDESRRTEVHHLKVSTTEETKGFRKPDQTMETMPVYRLVGEVSDEAMAEAWEASEKAAEEANQVARVEKYWLIDENAAIKVPAGWRITMGDSLPPPLKMVLQPPRNQLGLSILKEDPAELGVDSLDEYAQLKSARLQESFPEFQPSEPKAGEIGNLPARFFQGPGTVDGIEGEVICMTIKGKTSYYLFIGVVAADSPETTRGELMRVLSTFRERE